MGSRDTCAMKENKIIKYSKKKEERKKIVADINFIKLHFSSYIHIQSNSHYCHST